MTIVTRVSSPQGNATNATLSPWAKDSEKSFKSPRECYKLTLVLFIKKHIYSFKSPRECYKHIEAFKELSLLMFQVPKGMLQTFVSRCLRCSSQIGFKSPRECYKPAYYSYPYLILKAVSSPQGNATNLAFSIFCCKVRKSFKSPRECYKPLTPYYHSRRRGTFQVPKGMLQT